MIFIKIGAVEAELFHADGQTDMTKLIVAFHNFANAPKKRSATRVHLLILYESQSNQWLSSYTTLIGYFYKREGVCLLRGTNWIFK